MSAVTLKSTRFPAGTSVGAYPRSAWGGPSTSSPEGAPSGSASETAVVGADNSLTFSTLVDGVRYYAYANVGGENRIVGFTPGAASSSSAVTQTPGTSGHPSLLAPANPQAIVGSGTMTALQVRGVRARAGKTGILSNLYIGVIAPSGNMAVGVYNSAQPRAQLWGSGTIVVPTGPGWVSVGTPNVAVAQGQELDLVAQVDNAIATFYRYTLTNLALSLLPSAGMLDSTGQPYLMWALTLGAMGLAATIDDTTIATTASTIAIIGKIT